jgi:hypothetical protein
VDMFLFEFVARAVAPMVFGLGPAPIQVGDSVRELADTVTEVADSTHVNDCLSKA